MDGEFTTPENNETIYNTVWILITESNWWNGNIYPLGRDEIIVYCSKWIKTKKTLSVGSSMPTFKKSGKQFSPLSEINMNIWDNVIL